MGRIINMDRLTGPADNPGREYAARIIDAGLSAADPYKGVKRLVSVSGGKLRFDDERMVLKGDPRGGAAEYELDGIDR
ncbi:MAG: hypothetical protein FWE66_03965, partial [Oscillospiraceae bacterium]|nr:hypothetical protein [Oscillospiraceae bacterium]